MCLSLLFGSQVRADQLPHRGVVDDIHLAVAVDVAEDRRHGPSMPSNSLRTTTMSWTLTTPSSLKSPGRTSSRRVKVAISALPMVIVTRSALLIGWARVIV